MGSASTFEFEGVAFRGFRQWFRKSSKMAHSFFRGFRHAFRATTWLRMQVSGIGLFFFVGSAMGSAHRHANHVGAAMGSVHSPDPTCKSRGFRRGFRVQTMGSAMGSVHILLIRRANHVGSAMGLWKEGADSKSASLEMWKHASVSGRNQVTTTTVQWSS